ncbi:ribosomal protein S5 domain 2-type protein [Lineolata rhizophorae]|uniref:Small ribosomal subunit protein uS9m n=1 Tax=Lineolata rhizophorae TaxID=578093 RepID=A0A6A6PDF9_9PEZI|nr:ribosomal protein S5 domain 2-type protein [Lineolata rhizophorae]
MELPAAAMRRVWLRSCGAASRPNVFPRGFLSNPASRRKCLSTSSRRSIAAAEIDFDGPQSAPPPSGDSLPERPQGAPVNLDRLRIVPASPSYFTARPNFTDDLLRLRQVLRRYEALPLAPPGSAPKVAWKTFGQYKGTSMEPVKVSRYNLILDVLKRLNQIHPSLVPEEVTEELSKFKRHVDPHAYKPPPPQLDQWGRAMSVGKRKSSVARVWLVEGEGEVLVNNKTLAQAFARVHDRESAIWPLKVTQRIDKYNVWALVHGGGTTGQAEALTLAVAKAMLTHEPLLKPVLRRAGCITRDPRRVERKKPGKLKARKMPAWVKR